MRPPALSERLPFQSPADALAGFPRDPRGRVDWVAALRQDRIRPRNRKEGPGSPHVLDLDVLMKQTGAMPHVRFPHRPHTRWLTCSNCHPRPFKPKAGANAISMGKIMEGKACGKCHGKVAFDIYVCERCHSQPHPGSPEKWW